MTLFVKATRLVNGTPRFLDPRELKTHEPISDRGDYVGHLPHMQTLVFPLLRAYGLPECNSLSSEN